MATSTGRPVAAIRAYEAEAQLASGFALEDNLGVGAAAAVIVFGELLAIRVLDTQPVVLLALAVDLLAPPWWESAPP